MSGDESLLVDTLFDLPNTREMLDAMQKAHTAAADIDRLVNTHSNGDHTHGNELVAGAEIVASTTAVAEMEATTPEALAALMRGARANGGLVGDFLVECFGSFDFEGITHTLPDRTFDGQLTLTVGDKRVELTEVGAGSHRRRHHGPRPGGPNRVHPATSCSSRARRSSGRDLSRTGSTPATCCCAGTF